MSFVLTKMLVTTHTQRLVHEQRLHKRGAEEEDDNYGSSMGAGSDTGSASGSSVLTDAEAIAQEGSVVTGSNDNGDNDDNSEQEQPQQQREEVEDSWAGLLEVDIPCMTTGR